MRIRFQILTLCLLGLFLGNGCNRQKLPDGLPKLYPCKITIKDKDGNPMPGVIVSLTPEDPDNRWGGSGETNASGVATVLTAGKYPGLAPGKYSVVLMKFESVDTGRLDEEGLKIFESISLLPKEYTDYAKPPFQLEMEASALAETFQLEK